MSDSNGLEIAVIGLGGRFPGAPTIDAFWENLCAGRESIVQFSDEELLAAGIPREQLARPGYVKANGRLADIEAFDADFFQISAAEARAMCPQQRIFLMCCWEALEQAGYDPSTFSGAVGVYAGSGFSYYVLNLLQNPALLAFNPATLSATNFDKDFLATRVAYKLNLRGPAVAVQTACSTSLVGIHLACQALLAGECELALAGGVTVRPQQTAGYQHTTGSVLSADGHCRTFAATASGTVAGSGAGVVVLKRLDAALRDRDHIFAVVRGTAINNDGADKVGFAAPGASGQAAAIRQAIEAAGVEPGSISYVEAHGTATALGDPVEVQALADAFAAAGASGAPRRRPCALGSVKTNLGHLDAAAGVAGFIKTTLALHHRTLPASLHFDAPNPKIDFGRGGFAVNDRTQSWPEDAGPRRAGVSSFGIGGTNAHAVLEEAPVRHPTGSSGFPQLLVVSGRTAAAADAAMARLRAHLSAASSVSLDDVAFTLQVGRKAFPHRRALVCRDLRDACNQLAAPRTAISEGAVAPSAVVLAFPPLHPSAGFSPRFQQLCAWDPSVATWRDDCLAQAPAAGTGANFVYPCIEQIVCGRLWERFFEAPVLVTADGSGAFAAAVIDGRQEVPDALRLVTTGAAPTPVDPSGDAGPDPLVIEVGLAGGSDSAAPSSLRRRVRCHPDAPDGVSAFLSALGEAWRDGALVRWGEGLGGGTNARVPLPTYPFELKRYWLDPDVSAQPAVAAVPPPASADPQTLLYEACWSEVPAAGPADFQRRPTEWICVGADPDLDRRLQQAAADRGDRCTCLATVNAADATAIAERSRASGVAPVVIYAGVYTAAGNRVDSLTWAYEQPLRTVQRLTAALTGTGFTFVLLTRKLFPVGAGEPIQPWQALAHGVVLALAREYPAVRALTVDADELASPVSDRRQVLPALMAHVEEPAPEAVLALRGGRRWIRRFRPLDAPLGARPGWPIKEGAVCVITGGLGGLGFELARSLVAQQGAKVALIGRTSAADLAADPVRRQRLDELVRMSADVRYYSADVADSDALGEAWRTARRDLGPVNAIFHVAGAGAFKALAVPDRGAELRSVLKPKLQGTETLLRLATQEGSSLVVLFSSLSGVVGAGNQLEYVAANAFLDAQANATAASAGPQVLSVAWAGWSETGMRHDVLARSRGSGGSDGRGLKTADALAALAVALRAGRTNTFICDEEIGIKLTGLVNPVPTPRRGSAGEPPTPPADLATTVGAVWRRVIGNDAVSDQDDFFALGGDSLSAAVIANQLISAVPESAASVQDILTHPTIAQLTAVLSDRLATNEAVPPAVGPGAAPQSLECYLREQVQEILARNGEDGLDEREGIRAAAEELAGRIKHDHQFDCHAHELAGHASIAGMAEYLEREMRAPSTYAPSAEAFTFIEGAPAKLDPTLTRIAGPALVLSAPRCGSTLLRLMLSRHPGLFCPPELGLLGRDAPSEFPEGGDDPFLRGGMYPCLEEALGCDRVVAMETWAELRRTAVSNQSVYAAIQQAVRPRLLVEKTAGYAASRTSLQRAESWFDGTRYVCLVRHPYAAIESFVRKRFDKLRSTATVDPYLLAERFWSSSYRNLLELAARASTRTCFVRYEDLMARPEAELRRVCAFLGHPFVAAMLEPYAAGMKRFGLGDPDIHRHAGIEPELGEKWRHIVLPRQLARETTDLAAHFGYELQG